MPARVRVQARVRLRVWVRLRSWSGRGWVPSLVYFSWFLVSDLAKAFRFHFSNSELGSS